MSEILYGRNAARECLRARRRHIHSLLLADNIEMSAIIKEIIALAKALKVPLRYVPKHKLRTLAREHQGVVVEVGTYPMVGVQDILVQAAELGEDPFIVVLDHLEDPHNLGAMIRTVESVGAHGVIIPKKRAVGITPTVVKASAGATEHVWVAQVSNLVQSLNKLKQENVWVVGVEATAEAQLYHQVNLSGPVAVVIGSEGRGMGRLVRETCDFLVKLPMRGRIESLNASVAAGLILYETWRARSFNE